MRFIFLALTLVSNSALAYEAGDIFIDPHIAVGANVAQGTFVLAGLDAGFAVTDQVAVGVGGYYSFGEHPSDDREIGAGPFASFVQPLTSFLTAHIREDVDYIDQRSPIQVVSSRGGVSYTHISNTGIASITSVGLHVKITSMLGISAGYRGVISLANSDIGRDRSGLFLGASIGI